MAVTEKIEISVEATNNTKKWFDNVKDDIKGFNERIKSDAAIKLSLNVANIKSDLRDIQEAIKLAKKTWDTKIQIQLEARSERLKQELTQAQRELRNFARTWSQDVSVLGKNFAWIWDNIKNSFAGIGKAFVWLFAVDKIKDFWAAIVKLWTNLEQTKISFEVMLWSAEKAQVLLTDLSNFAKSTPFELTWLRETAKQLLAFGFSAEDIIPTLKVLWDVSAWLNVPIEQLAYAYWQVRSANQLYWTELRQFVNAWVPLLWQLAKQFWVTEAEAKNLVESWVVWFDDVQQAFINMTSEWWTFFNLMETQSKTVAWQWSNLKDTATQLWEQIWTKLLPVAQGFIDALKWLYISALAVQWWFILLWKNISNVFLSLKAFFFDFVTFVWDNFKILWENIWIAFTNIPALAKEWFNLLLKQVEWTVNKAIKLLNQIPWVKIEPLKIEWFNLAWTFKEFKAFTKASNQASRAAIAQIEDNNAVFEEYRQWLVWTLKDVVGFSQKLDTTFKNTWWTTTTPTWKAKGWWWTSQAKKDAEELKKLGEENAKEDEKLYQQKLKQEETKQAKYKQTYEALKDTYSKAKEIIQSSIDESKKGIEKFDEQIKNLKENITDLNEQLKTLDEDRATTLWERNVEILKRQVEIQKELNDLKSEEFTSDRLEQEAALNKELNSLLEEKRLIEKNATQAEIDEAKRISELSPTAKFLEDFEEKKKALEEERKLKEQQVSDLEKQKATEQWILEWFNQLKINLDTNYAAKSAEIEKKITDTLIAETAKRTSALEQLRLKAIETAEAMRKAWVNVSLPEASTATNTTNVWWITINWATNPQAVAKEVQKVIINASKNANKGSN